jgi:hypothetical protein
MMSALFETISSIGILVSIVAHVLIDRQVLVRVCAARDGGVESAVRLADSTMPSSRWTSVRFRARCRRSRR